MTTTKTTGRYRVLMWQRLDVHIGTYHYFDSLSDVETFTESLDSYIVEKRTFDGWQRVGGA